MTKLSVLDLAPITEGSDAGQSFRNSVEIAQLAEKLGYERYWLAEHHNIPGIASAATAVLLAHIGAHTRTIRIGSGGVMLPNHAPLIIAEQFGTLASLHPGRIDLGLGRAPGTDPVTAQALRRNLSGSVDMFPRDVLELQRYFEDPEPGQRVVAVPGAGLKVPIWILGSSLYGAELAAHLGLPYAFASHFAPADLYQALHVYRQNFRPSTQLDRPYVMVAMNLMAADTKEEAELIATSQMQAVLALVRGAPVKLQPPVKGFADTLRPEERIAISRFMTCIALGDRDDVRKSLLRFRKETAADEIILSAQIYDHAARLRAFEIAAEAMEALADHS